MIPLVKETNMSLFPQAGSGQQGGAGDQEGGATRRLQTHFNAIIYFIY